MDEHLFLWKALGPPFVLRLPFVYDPKSRRIWNNFKCNTRSARPRVITIAWPTLRPETWGGHGGASLKTARGLVRHEGFSTGGGARAAPWREVGLPDGQQEMASSVWCWSLLKWPIFWSTAHNRYCILHYVNLYHIIHLWQTCAVFFLFWSSEWWGCFLRSFQLVSPSSPKHRIQLPLWQTVPWMPWWAAARTPSWNKPPMVAMILRLGFGPAVHQDHRGWWQGWIKFQSLKPACWKHLRPINIHIHAYNYIHMI